MKGTKVGQKDKKFEVDLNSLDTAEFVIGKNTKYKGRLITIADRYKSNDREFIEFTHEKVSGTSVVPLSMFIRGLGRLKSND